MITETIKISSLKVKFKELLDIIDNAIEERKKIEIPNETLKQKNNIVLLIKWLQKHKIIDLITFEKKISRGVSIRSRSRKIEIALQLKALGTSLLDIAKIFKVKLTTVQGYLRETGKYDKDYLEVLKEILNVKGISINTSLIEFPIFPIREPLKNIKKRISSSDSHKLENIIKNNLLIKLITGLNLGTYDLSLQFPKK